MYLPPHFREDNPAVLRELMEQYPLATLVTLGVDGLEASHVPLLLEAGEGVGKLVLRGHLARGNRQWQDFQVGVEALAIFQGAQAYVSPNWYPSKQEDGRAVPTWDYVAVHARGALRVYSEPAPLREFLDRLTASQENRLPAPWKPSDAPPEYIEGLLRGIVGIEIAVSRLEGKWKTSQNQPERNRLGAAAALEARGAAADDTMARLIRERNA